MDWPEIQVFRGARLMTFNSGYPSHCLITLISHPDLEPVLRTPGPMVSLLGNAAPSSLPGKLLEARQRSLALRPVYFEDVCACDASTRSPTARTALSVDLCRGCNTIGLMRPDTDFCLASSPRGLLRTMTTSARSVHLAKFVLRTGEWRRLT